MNKKVLIIVIALVVLGVGGFFGWKTFASSEKEDVHVFDAEHYAELNVTIDEIQTNLSTPKSYAVVEFTVKLSDAKTAKEFGARISEAKSIVISTLASMEKSDLKGTEGVQSVVENLKTQFNDMLESGEVEKVSPTTFKFQ